MDVAAPVDIVAHGHHVAELFFRSPTMVISSTGYWPHVSRQLSCLFACPCAGRTGPASPAHLLRLQANQLLGCSQVLTQTPYQRQAGEKMRSNPGFGRHDHVLCPDHHHGLYA